MHNSAQALKVKKQLPKAAAAGVCTPGQDAETSDLKSEGGQEGSLWHDWAATD